MLVGVQAVVFGLSLNRLVVIDSKIPPFYVTNQARFLSKGMKDEL